MLTATATRVIVKKDYITITIRKRKIYQENVSASQTTIINWTVPCPDVST